MKHLLSIILLFIIGSTVSFAQKKKLPSFREIQAYNKTNNAVSALAKKNASHRIQADTACLSVEEINEVMKFLDDKIGEAAHKQIVEYFQSAINRKKIKTHGKP